MTEPSLYEHGLDRGCEPNQHGWVVYTGIEGEDPYMVAFVRDEQCAELLCNARDSDGSPVFCDPGYVIAVTTARGIYASNSTDISTHEQLEAAVALFEAAEEA